MTTFEQALSTTAWTELLQGGSEIYLNQLGGDEVSILFTDTGTTPSATTQGTPIEPQTDDWDFEASGLVAGTQRIWGKSKGNAVTVRGLR